MDDILTDLYAAGHTVTGGDRTLGGQSGGSSSRTDSRENTRQLEERLDQLTLICAAMWQLIRERTNLTEQDLAERMAIIDAKDGVADGKITRNVNKCPKCNRTMSPKHRRCLYCGFQKPMETVFDGV